MCLKWRIIAHLMGLQPEDEPDEEEECQERAPPPLVHLLSSLIPVLDYLML